MTPFELVEPGSLSEAQGREGFAKGAKATERRETPTNHSAQ
jgi:hypothetical protein